jgi:CRISPR-associated protein Csc3
MEIKPFADQLLMEFQEMELAETIAKSYNYKSDRNLMDLSMWNHVRNGVEAFLSLMNYLEPYELDWNMEELKIALVTFALHDLHKDPSIKVKNGTSPYAIPLEEIERVGRKLCDTMGVDVPAAFLRVGAVSSLSNKYGDFSALSDEYHWSYIFDWVKLMDQAASITSIAECLERNTIKNLEQAFRQVLPPGLARRKLLKIEFHRVQDVRGMLTTQLHNGMGLLMRRYGYVPWLHFGDGTLHVSIDPQELPTGERLSNDLIELFFRSIANEADLINSSSLFKEKMFDLHVTAFLLYSKPEEYAKLFHSKALNAEKRGSFPESNFKSNQLTAYRVENEKELLEYMGVSIERLDKEFREKWHFTVCYMASLQCLVQRLNKWSPVEAFRILARFFTVEVEDIIEKVPSHLQSNNKRYDLVIWLAYRYLMATNVNGNPVSHIPPAEWGLELKDRATHFLQEKVTLEQCMHVVEKELNIRKDLERYFKEELTVSWNRRGGEQLRAVNELDEKELLKKKNRTQRRICNLCNRQIDKSVKLPKVKEGIIHDTVSVFSNRLLPKEIGPKKEVSPLHWCGICYFEFVLRQVFSLNSPGHKDKSHRIYLFAFPSFQLTGEYLAQLHEDLKGWYGSIQVHPRGACMPWQSPYVNGEKGHLRDHLRSHFQRYSEYFVQEMTQGSIPPVADLLKVTPPGNILMFTYDCYSSQQNGVNRTREEAWMKALTTALSLNKLYGFRIFITEKPFLFLSDVREIPYAVQLDAPPYKVAQLLRDVKTKPGFEFVIPIERANDILYRLAYLWEIHRFLHPYQDHPTDKAISSILHTIDCHPLPGAHFFKRYLAENVHAVDGFHRSCMAINLFRGGNEMEVARQIALASLALYQPYINKEGRAHRYEQLFRLVVKGIKNGAEKSALKGSVMKRLERLRNQKNGFVVSDHADAIERLVDLVYDRVYLEICGGSLAKLTQKENQIADGVFFEIHMEGLQGMEKRKQEKKKDVTA